MLRYLLEGMSFKLYQEDDHQPLTTLADPTGFFVGLSPGPLQDGYRTRVTSRCNHCGAPFPCPSGAVPGRCDTAESATASSTADALVMPRTMGTPISMQQQSNLKKMPSALNVPQMPVRISSNGNLRPPATFLTAITPSLMANQKWPSQ